MRHRNLLFSCIAFHLACQAADGPHANGLFAKLDLRRSCARWKAGFADYPVGQESYYELEWACDNNPANMNRGLFISSSNHSDDLFMFVARPIHGLKPLSAYRVEAEVVFLSKAPTGCAGIGGDPGANVYVKFGASTDEPATFIDENGVARMNVDVGYQSQGGADAEVIGNIATSITDCHNEQYQMKELETQTPLTTQSDQRGVLWIFVGTDSGFEGKTSVIYTEVRVHIRPHNPATAGDQTPQLYPANATGRAGPDDAGTATRAVAATADPGDGFNR